MIQFDSRKVKKGDTFVAIKGLTADGNDYINESLKNGAKKVYRNSTSKELAELAKKYFGDPSSKLKIIGVTGTKGKTTTAHMIAHILEKEGKKVGLISSISDTGYHVTTPDIISINNFLSKMVKNGKEYIVLEVSSHGIEQGRILGIKFEVTVLTNIKPEHLDYHKTFAEYKKIKQNFLKTGKIQIKSPKTSQLKMFPGEFNNINADTATRVAQELGIRKEEAVKALETFKLPEGRMEEIPNTKGFRVFIDFAHTPDSLEKALLYLKSLKPKKLISVFGCAGDRDPYKRPKMGKISTQIADLSVFTAEDPRSEDLNDILDEMQKDVEDKDNFISIPERGEAIAYAISKARSGDIVGIFGKGHEKSICWGKNEYPWSDQDMVKAQLSSFENVSAIIMAAGFGSRMNSDIPKVIHKICDRSMISLTIENLRFGGVVDVVIVVGYKKELIIKAAKGFVKFALQKNPKGGTADAVNSGLSEVGQKSEYVLALYGDDSAFFKPTTTKKVIEQHIQNNATISFISAEVANPTGLGRVVRGKNNEVVGIIEEKDADDTQKNINEVNCGHFIFNKDWLLKNINSVKVSPSGERYIVDLIKMAINQDRKVVVYKLPDRSEWQGVNKQEHLISAEKEMTKRLQNYAKSI